MKDQTILVVDDEPDFCELVTYRLQQAGYDVITAADGLTALEKARWQKPDLILLDLMLPELDGLSVCELLVRHPNTGMIPVIMLTACKSEPLRQHALEIGVRHYLTKPFGRDELLEKIQDVLAPNRPVPSTAAGN